MRPVVLMRCERERVTTLSRFRERRAVLAQVAIRLS